MALAGGHQTLNSRKGGVVVALTQNEGYRDELNVAVAVQSQLLKLLLLMIRENHSGVGEALRGSG